MHRSRTLLLSNFGSLSSTPKLILPQPGILETAFTALQGAWSVIVDRDKRNALEEAAKKEIIKESVLARASNGSLLMFSLFQNLQNPLWKEYKIDFKEFIDSVGPALENFHDTLGRLRNQMPENMQEEKRLLDEQLKKSDEEIISNAQNSMTETLLGVNHWQQQAKENPDSLAASFAKMTTPVCFDAFFYTSKMDILGAPRGRLTYEEGSCNVAEVALLNARAMVMDRETDDPKRFEYEEFRASEDPEPPVAAQVDVLYEITQTYQQVIPLETSDGQQADLTIDTKESSLSTKTERLSYTNLVVAVFEGWLHDGPDKELRWRVAMLREPWEFPPAPPTITKLD